MPQYFWPAKVVAVNTDDGTVDLEYEPDRDGASECFYSRVNLRYVKAKPTPVDDGPVSVAIVPASDCPEDPLIEIRRRKNIAELKELLIRLGLDQPLIPPRPKPRPPKPRPPPATSPADRRHQRRGAAVAQPLQPYEIGFDFAFCGAPLAWQYIAIRDLLTSCYGDAAAVDILTRFCTIDGKLRRDPLELFVFASVGFTVIGAMVVRWQTCTAMGRQLVEVVFTAIAPEVESPDTIRRVLESYAEVVAQLSLHHALLLAWHDPGAPTCAEDTRWQRGECSGFGGVALAPPAHTADFVLCVCKPRHNAWKHFQLAVARAVAALVRADSQALKDVQTAATDRMDAASRLADTATPPTPEPVQCALTPGRLIAIWGEMDAQFFVQRVDALRSQVAGDSYANPTANASHLRVPGVAEVKIEFSAVKWDDAAGDYVPDDKTESSTTYLHELVRCKSLVLASDREATIRSGMAIDLQGAELLVGRPWYPVSLTLDAPEFAQQLHEILGAADNIIEDECVPELATHYHDMKWGTDVQVLYNRCLLHCERYADKPTSASSAWAQSDREPEGWRCQSWDEVIERIGSLNILSDYKASGDEDDDEESEALQPGTTPRTLELYCGRAGWSAHHKRRGSDAWYVDIDKKWVTPSFANSKPEYMEDGTIMCLNGLDREKFIHLDFIDFAMAVLTNRVNIGDLHAIHDGFDCTTYTQMAKSKHRRYLANSFCGTSELAFATNIRHQYLVAFHLYVLDRQGSSMPCIRTAENPKAERQLHPLTQHVLEQPKANGGLGMAKAIVSYCTAVDAEWQKTSAIWTDDADTLAEFVRADGSVKYECSCRGTACNNFNGHRQIRPGKGEVGRADRGSIYPDGLCQMLIRAAQPVLATVRQLRLDPAMTHDGKDDACRSCNNQRRGGIVHTCDFCPSAYHWGCIPRGKPRPQKQPAKWACPACHSKGRLTAADAEASSL